MGPANFCFKHITVSNTLLCPAVYCVKQNTVSTLAFNIWLFNLPNDHRSPMLFYVCCVFLMFKHWFCWMYQDNKYMFNFIDIYIFIPVSGCLGRAQVNCFGRGLMMLLRRPCSQGIIVTDIWKISSEITGPMVKYETSITKYSLLFYCLCLLYYWKVCNAWHLFL